MNAPLSQLGLFLARKGRRAWTLKVSAKGKINPRMTRVQFVSQDLNELVWKRGQDLVLELPQTDGQMARRHYTIRHHDAEARTLAIDMLSHGDSPAGHWLEAVKVGDEIVGVGPRGHTYLRDADWHLFVGDETGLPAILAMAEALPKGTMGIGFVEIASDADRQSVPATLNLTWVPHGDGALGRTIGEFLIPEGRGHAYVIGETSEVRAVRHGLLSRGLGKDQISAEGYWRPGRIGGHDHV